ncbi:hypothetical protein Vretifemale_6265 [Volvox reticuliferus]|uniref:Uncharacterized protein n=1 Tax=Volvox reticuliferus TaxID=1737510 RepID=A0A8J4C732_9CHLO|nr:hypothetical protein Vretifemale_6265 [Volvox reticuliferus]
MHSTAALCLALQCITSLCAQSVRPFSAALSSPSSPPPLPPQIKKARTAALEIPVPPGTVVKRRGTGALLGELLQPGQRLTVVTGGKGGHGVVAPSRQQRQARVTRAEREAKSKGVELVDVEDDGWRTDSRGQPGQQLTLTLLLRVVADVGLVGLPNAGKSSLLKALTRASPTIAPYPFTTLMPNLGVMSAGGGTNKAVLADLPGLIEGAHKGRGLGRNFLRHLRRTRALLHVVDVSGPDPATDYFAVREELRMYNPDYCARPYVVALNKTDLLQQQQQQQLGSAQLISALREAARRQVAEHKAGAYDGPAPMEPLAIVPCSAATGEGLKELAAALQRAIGLSYISEPDIVRPAPDTLAAARSPSQVAAAGSADGSAVSAAVATAAVTADVAVTAVTATSAFTFSSPPRGSPPPPPPGWDDDGGGGDVNTAGRTHPFDDAAAELEEGEIERLTARCQELGLMDERGNFLAYGPSSAGGLETAADLDTFEGSVGRVHDALDEEELSFVDAHPPGGVAPGDGAADDDEWVELSTLDEQTLAAVLDELERGGGGEDEAPFDLRYDFRMAPSGQGKHQQHQQQPERGRGQRREHQGHDDDDDDNDSGVGAEGVVLSERTNAQHQHQHQGAAGEDGVKEMEEGELVRMAPSDDPDARLLSLSLEELLAMEKDW